MSVVPFQDQPHQPLELPIYERLAGEWHLSSGRVGAGIECSNQPDHDGKDHKAGSRGQSMARNEQLIRQHKILELLEAYRFGRTLDELRDAAVEELGLTSLHSRSIRRDLEALQAAGFDVVTEDAARGRVWKLGPRARKIHKISITATELIALALGRDLMFPLAGTTFWQGIESFWQKIQDELPDGVWSHYQKYRNVLHVLGVPAKSYADKQSILKTINRAILEHRVVDVAYRPVGKPVGSRTLEPYGVVFYQSSLYIIATDAQVAEADDAMRHWKLDRFEKATLLDKWFQPQDGFDLESHVGRSVGIFAGSRTRQYRIRISQRAAPWVLEDPWHASQKVKRRRDGDIELTVVAAHDMEVIPRVLALGAEAELLSPASCRQQIAEIVKELGKRYG